MTTKSATDLSAKLMRDIVFERYRTGGWRRLAR
jgi:hypothetical protein